MNCMTLRRSRLMYRRVAMSGAPGGENLHLLCAGAGKLFHFPLVDEQHGRFAGDTGVNLAGDQ